MMKDMPIPGENFTSDTKGYPWHQPPEFTALGPALDKMAQKMTDKKTAPLLISMVETGLPLYKVAQIIVMEGMANGKWTLDLGLLLAGPITKIMEVLCNIYEVEYTIGIEDEDDMPTGKFTRGILDINNEVADKGVLRIVQQEMPNIKAEAEEQETPEGGSPEAAGPTEEEGLGEQGFAVMSGDAPSEEEDVPEEETE
jgi:hypothetical protein